MLKTLLSTMLFLFIFTIVVSGQDIIGVVEYIKAENPDDFLKVEKEWHPIYRNLIKENEMDGCSVYQVMYKNKDTDYNYIKILWFDAFSKINFQFNYDYFYEAYPNKKESDWKSLQHRTKENYEVIKSGVFQMKASCANGLDTEGSLYRVSEIHIQPGKSKEYLNLIKEIYMPVYQEDVKNRNRTTWSVWAKWTGSLDTFEYTTADGFANMDQFDKDHFTEDFSKVHPDKNLDEINDRMKELSVLNNWEVWKIIYRILK